MAVSPVRVILHTLHPHSLWLQADAGPDDFGCDVCGGADAQRWRCTAGCDWDADGKCCPLLSPDGVPLTPGAHAHAHAVDAHAVTLSLPTGEAGEGGDGDASHGGAAGAGGDNASTKRAGGAAATTSAEPPRARELPLSAKVASHEHVLAWEADPDYACNVCSGTDARRYRCQEGCDWDMCGSCFDVALSTVVMFRGHEHAFTLHAAAMGPDAAPFGCDGCRREFGQTAPRYHCVADCDHDYCTACGARDGVVDSIAVNPDAPLVRGPEPGPEPGPGVGDLGDGAIGFDAGGVFPDVDVRLLGSRLPTSVVHPSHAHPLVFDIRFDEFACDVCGGTAAPRYRCEADDYDVCGQCCVMHALSLSGAEAEKRRLAAAGAADV